MQRAVLIAATVGAVWSGSAQRAEACTCQPPTIESSYNTNTEVVRVLVMSKWTMLGTTYYRGITNLAFKGCLDHHNVMLATPATSAACGQELTLGQYYLINANLNGTFWNMPILAFDLCDYNVPYANLTAHDSEFLTGRTVCCGASCECADGSAPVSCFVDPCQVAQECNEGQCVANYCGGCNAEFYDASGYAVCGGSSS
jgi:hypothetical protein